MSTAREQRYFLFLSYSLQALYCRTVQRRGHALTTVTGTGLVPDWPWEREKRRDGTRVGDIRRASQEAAIGVSEH